MARKTNRVCIVTDEQVENINPVNRQLIEEYIDYMETTDKAPKSIMVYRSNLNIFFVWYSEKCGNKEFFDIKKRDVLNFQNYLIKRGLSPARIRALRASISSLSNYIESILDEDYPNFRNIINKIPAPTLNAVREKTIMTDEQLENLLKILVEKEKYQIACFVAIACFSGARKSELIQYKRSFFNDETVKNGLYVTKPIRTKGRGVVGKVMPKYALKNKVDYYLELWDKERKDLGVEIDDLFVVKSSGNWECAKTTTADSFMETCSRIAGEDIYAHSLRHFFVSYLSRSGVPISIIKDVVGHNDSSTTELYDDNSKDDKFSQYFSDEGIKQVEQKGLNSLD